MIILQINYNMRCIETGTSPDVIYGAVLINYNMRCIETSYFAEVKKQLIDKLQHEMY